MGRKKDRWGGKEGRRQVGEKEEKEEEFQNGQCTKYGVVLQLVMMQGGDKGVGC